MFSLLVAASIPVVFLCTVLYVKDTEREPIQLLVKAFAAGMLIILPVLVFETALDSLFVSFKLPSTTTHFLQAFFVAGLVEEYFKFYATRRILNKNKYYDQFYDGIVYSAFVSLGFAFVENISYVFEHGFGTALMRGLLSVPAHAFFGIIMGYYLSLALKGDPSKRPLNLQRALLVPVVLHGLFDFFLMDMTGRQEAASGIILLYLLLFFGLNIFLWRSGLKKIKNHIAIDRKNNNLNNGEGRV